MRLAALILLACVPAAVQAHTFGRLYTLPVPFWLYAWGAGSALIVSFLAAGYFMAAPAPAPAVRVERRSLEGASWLAALRRWRLPQLLRAASVAMLLLTIATGLFGNQDPLHNISMTAFWVVFLLGGTYATVVFGNVYAWLNPWQTLTAALARVAPAFDRARLPWPERLDAWPALALYLALIWIELSLRGTPFTLGAMLAGYTVLNVAAVWAFGSTAWFRHGEVFSVFFRIVGTLAPVDYERGVALRAPGAGALDARPARLATVVFLLAMLASTAYDGLRETQSWSLLFWHDPLGVFSPLFGDVPIREYIEARPWHRAWDSAWMFVAPFVYFAVYALTVWLSRVVAGSDRPVRELLLDFAYTLVPIVVAYHAAHYATLLLDQGPKILSYASDPFGRGWNLFGTTNKFRAAYLPELDRVWHAQVLLILAGHVASVVLAHHVALRVFPTRLRALASQVPMLLLMLAFTISGLWIMCQPLTQTMVR